MTYLIYRSVPSFLLKLQAFLIRFKGRVMIDMLKVLLRLTLPLLALSVLSCTPPNSSSNRTRGQELVPEREERNSERENSRHYSRFCKEDSDKVSLRDLDFIDSNNAGAYTLRGHCDEENMSVRITVNNYYTVRDNPVCDNNRWEVELDLSSIVTKEKNIVFQVTHDNESICREARVAFLGPAGYIPVPPLEDYYEFSFFVMKYEAKVEERSPSAKAVSKPEGVPLTRINHEQAVKLCRNNGSRYDLIRNDQWQNIVLSIEDTDENWLEGKNYISDRNTINCGITRSSPQPAKSNDLDDCAGHECNKGWDINRRTHILANGERIWDICGNVGEIMKDKYTAGEEFKGDIYELSGKLKKLFGPKRKYQLVGANRRTNKWNLGYAEIKDNHNLIIRGLPGYYTGIFSTQVNQDQESRRGYDSSIGFRCVYLP